MISDGREVCDLMAVNEGRGYIENIRLGTFNIFEYTMAWEFNFSG